MNTNHARAAALTAVLAGLVLGVPAIASAGPGTTPVPWPIAPHPSDANQRCLACSDGNPASPGPTAPRPSNANQPCLACNIGKPALTGSNSGASDEGGQHPIVLLVTGKNFTANGNVHIEVWVDGANAPDCSADAPADSTGVIDSDRTGCHTDALAASNGYAQATDVATGQQSNRLPVKVYVG